MKQGLHLNNALVEGSLKFWRKKSNYFLPRFKVIFLNMNITLRQDTCFADLVAKTKKFNKAQVEFRLAKRVER